MSATVNVRISDAPQPHILTPKKTPPLLTAVTPSSQPLGSQVHGDASPGGLTGSPHSPRTHDPYGCPAVAACYAGLGEADFDASWRPLAVESGAENDGGGYYDGNEYFCDDSAEWDESWGSADEFGPQQMDRASRKTLFSEYACQVMPSLRRLPPSLLSTAAVDVRSVVRLQHKLRSTFAVANFAVDVGTVVLVERMPQGKRALQTDCGLVTEKIALADFDRRLQSQWLPPGFPRALPRVNVLRAADDADMQAVRRLEEKEAALAASIRQHVATLPPTDELSLVDVETCEYQFDENLVYVYFRAAKFVTFRPLLDVLFRMCKRPVWMHQIDRTPLSSANTSVSSSGVSPPAATVGTSSRGNRRCGRRP